MNIRSVPKVVIVAGLLGTASMSLAASDIWTTKAPMPTRRLGLSTSVVNGKIYAIGGGYSIEGPHSRIVEEYNPVADTWTRKADMPTGRIGHAASVVNGKIYVIGGDVRMEVSGSEVEEYDPATDTWTKKADMPTKRTFLCAGAVDGKIYAIGGITAPAMHTLSTVEVYDPATDTWTTKANMPTARWTASLSVVRARIYALGGIRDTAFRAVEEYDPITDIWTRKADMPTARASLCTSVVNGRIYAVGGGSDFTGPALKTVEEYDPITNTWAAKADMPTPRWFFSTSAVDGKIYAIAGSVEYPPHSSVSTVEEYDPHPFVVDLNADKVVNFKDFSMLAQYWYQDQSPLVNHRLDYEDLAVLADCWLREILPASLIARWKLDETEGFIAHDSVGDKDGTLIGEPVWRPTDGILNGALELAGIDDFVSTPFSLNPAAGPFSAFAWAKGGGPGQVVVSQSGGADWLLADAEGRLMTTLKRSSFSPTLASEYVITDDDWHHIGFVWDGSHRHLYADGIAVAEDTADVGYLRASNGTLYIGAGATLDPGSFFSGLIDDVRIYERAVAP